MQINQMKKRLILCNRKMMKTTLFLLNQFFIQKKDQIIKSLKNDL